MAFCVRVLLLLPLVVILGSGSVNLFLFQSWPGLDRHERKSHYCMEFFGLFFFLGVGRFAGDEVFAYGHEWEATVADCGAPRSRFSEEWTDMNILYDPSFLFSVSDFFGSTYFSNFWRV